MTRMNFAGVLCAALAFGASCGDDGDEGVIINNSRDQKEETCMPGETRCVDSRGAALCPANTGYEGDGLALCPPATEQEGVLLHYGPTKPDGTVDPVEAQKYMLAPGAEIEECVYVRSTNTQPMWIDAYQGRMRPNSHHLIVTLVPESEAKDLPLNVQMPCNQVELFGNAWLVGSQDPKIDIFVEGTTPGAEKAKEGDPEFGAAQLIQPNQVMRLDLHYINITDKPIMREAWVFLRAVAAEKVKQRVDMVTFFQTAINVPPQSKGWVTPRGECTAPSDRYLALATGHFHENGKRFTMWHHRADGVVEKIYNTYDWDVPGNGFYNDRVKNPRLEDEGIWGAKSGYVHVKQGEKISFECEFDNPSNTPVTLGELGKDQMCNVFGLYYPSDGSQWNCRCVGTLCF